MADRPKLSVVGGRAPEPDAEADEIVARVSGRIAEAAKTDGLFWAVTVVKGETSISYFGGKLETSALAEELARAMKCAAMGLSE